MVCLQLQDAFAVIQTEPLNEFSKKLEGASLSGFQRASINKIQKKWAKLAQDLLSEPAIKEKLQERIQHRKEKIATALKALEAVDLEKGSADPLPDQLKSTADLLAPVLARPDVKYHYEKELPPKALELYQTHKKSLEQVELLFKNILERSYGEKFAAALSNTDPERNPFIQPQAFFRLLLIDLILRNENPKEACEWFFQLDSAIIGRIQTAIQNYVRDMQTIAGIKTPDIYYLLATNKANLSDDIKKDLSTIAAKQFLPGDAYKPLCEHLRIHYAPSKEQLYRIAESLVVTDPELAFDTVCLIDKAEPKRAILILRIVHSIEKKTALRLIEKVKDDSQLYFLCLLLFTKQLILQLHEEPFQHELKSYLVKLPTLRAQARLLDCCLERLLFQIEHSLEQGIQNTTALLELIEEKDLKQLGYSYFFFYLLCREESPRLHPKLLDIYASISDEKTQKAALRRCVDYLFQNWDGAKALARLELLWKEPKLESQRFFIIAETVVSLPPKFAAKAESLIAMIPDIMLQIELESRTKMPAKNNLNFMQQLFQDSSQQSGDNEPQQYAAPLRLQLIDPRQLRPTH